MRRLLAALCLVALVGAFFATAQTSRVRRIPTNGELIVAEQGKPLIEPRSEEKGEPWLGILVSKPAAPIYDVLTDIPQGVGFLLTHVVEGGPAAVGGLRKSDILLKIDDQLIVNEAQFLVLLHLRAVGDEVALTYYRGGAEQVAHVILGSRPESETGRQEADSAVQAPPIPGQLLDVTNRVVKVRDNQGVVSMERDGGQFRWVMVDTRGARLREGWLPEGEKTVWPEGLDPVLQAKLSVLTRAIQISERQNRPSRVRRIPTPAPSAP